jgi:hypothetical protein
MKQYTLLEIVTTVLDSMDSDPIDSITDTDESQQLIRLIEDEYFRLATDKDWKHLRVVGQLTAVADANYPNYLQIPDDIESLELIKYNVKEDAADDDAFKELTYIEDPSEFLSLSHSLNSTDSEVDEVTDYGGGTFLIRNDRVPTCWTTFDDEYIVFDSFLSTLDATLPANKSVFMGYKAPVFTEADGTILDMPGRMFPAFIERVKAIAHADLKGQESSVHSAQAISSGSRINRNVSRTQNPRGTNRHPRYGRK